MSEPAVLNAITVAMKNLSYRQQVISGNIANSETPGYKACDVKAPDFSKLLDASLTRTSPRVSAPRVELTPGMMALGMQPVGLNNATILDKDISETKPDGNNVTLEDQLMKMGDIQAKYTALASMSRKLDGFMSKAIGVKV